MKKITVLAAVSQQQLEKNGCAVDQECETIAQAKKRAKYYLTEEYMNACESTTMLQYSQVRVNDDVVYDFFGKDHVTINHCPYCDKAFTGYVIPEHSIEWPDGPALCQASREVL